MKPRRAFALFLFAAGCFGLGLVAARLVGWGGREAPDPAKSTHFEPHIYIDAGEIVLYDGSLKIDPPPPPNVDPP